MGVYFATHGARHCQCGFGLQPVWILGIVLCALVTMATSGTVELSKDEMAALETVTQGTNKFAISLYRALSRNQAGNVFVSPLSVQMVLALAYTGAKGSTADEVAKVLSLPEKLDNTYSGYNALIRILQDPVLKLANRMFVEKTAGVLETFQKNAEKYFLSPAESVDFMKDTENARVHINSWVEDQTNKKITNLLAPGILSCDTRLVLVNAIHFKANWSKQFQEKDTKEQPFHVSKTKSVPVQMMNIKKKFGFVHDKDLGAKILELEYEGGHFRMLVILPDEIDGLAKLEEKLEKVNLSDKIKYMQQPTVTVALPKFKMEETMDLNDILKSMGVETMFSQKANFSGISDVPLVVSKVVQKAFVEVNEKGTEAAAATGFIMMRNCARVGPTPQSFIADHPFLFIIMFKNTTLFVGRMLEVSNY
ncbi:serpin B6-like isoform X4 [Homalodisca vitripennis]|uniref:serpin B6-like isoform X4 n=1 Tax=Homalodisca vitripennis TaxID=197043 RepID=UPI001EECA0CA|nr:serpin B6-like isoform X4 [Homalodisca vitripennis]